MLVKGGPDHNTDAFILNFQIVYSIKSIIIGLTQKMDLWKLLQEWPNTKVTANTELHTYKGEFMTVSVFSNYEITIAHHIPQT